MVTTLDPADQLDGHDTPTVTKGRSGDRWLGMLLFALGVGLALNSVLGPLFTDAIDYSLSESLQNQLIGLDAVSLLLVAPLCLAAGTLALRGRPWGAVIALGPTTYTVYMLVQYLVGPGYLHYPAVLTFHLGLFVLGGVVTVRAWTTLAPEHLPTMTRRAQQTRAFVLFGLAAFVVARYLPAIIGSASHEALTDEFSADPAFLWTILLMDLGIVVPCTIATAIALRRGAPVAAKAMYGVVGWFALVPPSVAAMAISMVVNDDPNASTGATVLFITAAVAFAAFAVHVYRPLLTFAAHRNTDAPA